MDYLDLEENPFKFEINVIEVESDSKVEIDDYAFEFVSLPPANNHGLKFRVNSRTVAITGDSYFHEKEVEFLMYSDIAIIDSAHLTQDEIIQLANSSKVQHLYLSHQSGKTNMDILSSKVSPSTKLYLPNDMDRVSLY